MIQRRRSTTESSDSVSQRRAATKDNESDSQNIPSDHPQADTDASLESKKSNLSRFVCRQPRKSGLCMKNLIRHMYDIVC